MHVFVWVPANTSIDKHATGAIKSKEVLGSLGIYGKECAEAKTYSDCGYLSSVSLWPEHGLLCLCKDKIESAKG